MFKDGGVFSTVDSTYLFIRPESIKNDGIITTNFYDSRIYNPEIADFSTLSESAPLTIEFNNTLANEIQQEIQNSDTFLNASQFSSFSNDFGDKGNVTIKLSDYLDENGEFDNFAFNSDQRFTLEISNDISKSLNSFDDVSSWVSLNTDLSPDGGTSSQIHLQARDHDVNPYDSNAGSGSIDPRNYVEETADANSVIELRIFPTFRVTNKDVK